jgi:urocanate hydratase
VLAERGIVPDVLAGQTSAELPGVLELQKLGAKRFEAENYIRALSHERTPLTWEALSGEPSDIYRIDRLLLEMFPDDEMLGRWLPLARKHLRFQGLPARTCWLRYDDVAKFGMALNETVTRGEVKAPIAIALEKLDPTVAAMPDKPTIETIQIVADGSPKAAAQMERMLTNDTGTETTK